ncbi:MAG: hypothetical protein ACYDFT_01440 [Thermoplasmata archaeon]
MNGREMAWRVLAAELSASTEEERGEDERSTAYLLSPLGARMHRVLLAGTVGPVESTGKDPARPFLRAPIRDPSGTVTLTAGGFQPRGLSALAPLALPIDAIVLGKVHLFRGGGAGATSSISVRVEEFRPTTAAEVVEVHREATLQTGERISLARRLRAHPRTSDDELARSGYPRAWIQGVRRAMVRYPSVDPERFHAMLGTSGTGDEPSEAGTGRPTPPFAPGPPTRPEPGRRPEADPRAGIFLDLIDELLERSSDGLADLSSAVERAARCGLGASQVEELLNRLEEEGVLEEPTVGKLRRA